MSSSTIAIVMGRIELATPESPIALFISPIKGEINAVFAATVETQRRIRVGDRDYIGTHDRTHPLEAVRAKLKHYAG